MNVIPLTQSASPPATAAASTAPALAAPSTTEASKPPRSERGSSAGVVNGQH